MTKNKNANADTNANASKKGAVSGAAAALRNVPKAAGKLSGLLPDAAPPAVPEAPVVVAVKQNKSSARNAAYAARVAALPPLVIAGARVLKRYSAHLAHIERTAKVEGLGIEVKVELYYAAIGGRTFESADRKEAAAFIKANRPAVVRKPRVNLAARKARAKHRAAERAHRAYMKLQSAIGAILANSDTAMDAAMKNSLTDIATFISAAL